MFSNHTISSKFLVIYMHSTSIDSAVEGHILFLDNPVTVYDTVITVELNCLSF